MLLNEYKCPECGSNDIETYKDKDKIHIKCESCGKILKTHIFKECVPSFRKAKKDDGIQKGVLSSVTFMIVMAIVLGLLGRLLTGYYGFV